MEGIRYTPVSDIKETEADITLAGHYHYGFGIIRIDDRYFANPGGLARITASSGDINRIPGVLIIELGKTVIIEELKLKSALPGDEVLSRSRDENSADRIQLLGDFYKNISSARGNKKVDINEILEMIAQNTSIQEEVKAEALGRISRARESAIFGDDEL